MNGVIGNVLVCIDAVFLFDIGVNRLANLNSCAKIHPGEQMHPRQLLHMETASSIPRLYQN